MPVLGRKVDHPIECLEVFDRPPGFAGTVRFRTAEPVPSLCPVTGQPDQTYVTITYQPGEVCIESKSLKLYLWGFRNEGHFVESMAALIAERVMLDAKPPWVEVECRQAVRGGIETVAVCRKEQ